MPDCQNEDSGNTFAGDLRNEKINARLGLGKEGTDGTIYMYRTTVETGVSSCLCS
jgi:hypothetical protein